jgi:AraC family transcriptional regulator, ethanolamine operon transcriptional activator
VSFNKNLQHISTSTSETISFHQKHSQDFDEQATFLNKWNQDYTQISAGSFKGFVSEVHFDELSLYWEYTSQSLYQQGHLDDETIAIGVPLSSLDNGLFCGAACGHNAIHVYSGKQGFEFVSPQHLMMGLIVMNRNKLFRLLSADDQYFLNLQCKQAHIARIPYLAYINLVHFLKSTFQTLKSQASLASNRLFIDEITANATQLVCESLLNKERTAPDTMRHKSWEVLTVTREMINKRQDNPMSVAELCESLDMSRRSLQYHFEQALHTSPVAYLRAERLNVARHLLKTANSVTEAATHWGFWHFGHFSQEYKKMFGELPSETFKRLHRLN